MVSKINISLYFVVGLTACFCCAAGNVKDNVTDLYLIGLFPMTGSWNAGLGMSIAAAMAVEDINSRSDILPGYRLNMSLQNTECDPGLGIKALADNICHSPTKIMIIGAGCSPVSRAVAQAAHRWNLIQISFVSSSPELSNRKIFPNFYRVVNSESVLNEARMEIFKYFNWTRVATLHQTYHLFSTMIEGLVGHLNEEKFVIAKESVFSENPEREVQRLKEADARIIIAGMYRDKARKVFCAAYNVGFYGRQVWLTSSTLSHDSTWWKEPDPSINCTREQLEEAAQGTLIVSDIFANFNDTEEGLTGISVQRFRELYRERTRNMTQPVSGSGRAPAGYDTVWAAAIALNKTMNNLIESGSSKKLDDFSYEDNEMAELMKHDIREVNFRSISGQVAFNKGGDGVRLIAIQMIRGSSLVTVGTYDVTKPIGKRLVIGDIWQGQVPRDRKLMARRIISLPAHIYVPVMSLAGLGIIIGVTFLSFNISNRNVKIIRMTSPNINNIILVGCILAYMSVFVEDINDTKNGIYCMSKSFFLLFAFSLSFGALFAKTWRTYSIFGATLQMRKLKNRSIQDHRLCLMVVALVCLNSLVLFIWIVIDPQTVITEDIPNMKDIADDMIIQYACNSCWSKHQNYFLICIMIIQGILLLLGVFLAWETRKVELSMLNESRYIAICIYNVVVMVVFGVVVSYSLNNNPNLVYIVTSSVICLYATVTQCLLFVPKVVACRKFKQGKLQSAAISTIGGQFCTDDVGKTSIGSQTDVLF